MQEVTTLPIPVNRHIICGHSHKIGNPNILNVFEIKDTKKLFKSNIRYCHISHVDWHVQPFQLSNYDWIVNVPLQYTNGGVKDMPAMHRV
jgi:hypothetical protein